MPSIIVDLGDPKEYDGGESGEEYKQCKEWAREISLLKHDGIAKHANIGDFVSSFYKGDFAETLGKLKGSTIGKCIKTAGEKNHHVYFSEIRHVIRSANRILSPIGGSSLTLPCFLFLLTIASYTVVEDPNNNYMDLIKLLKGGEKVASVSVVYTKDELGEQLYIGTLSKLMGITQSIPERMDCPRVWDLEEDDIVENPNLQPIETPHPIVSITHRWVDGEATYAGVLEQRRADVIMKRTGHSAPFVGVSTMGAKSRKDSESTKLEVLRSELQEMGVRYVWMDTLCIDKTSSAETDEAIRSMYRWYSEAWFVYLESDTDLDNWATRGWTLQEGAAAKALRVSPHRADSFMELLSNANWDDIRMRNLALEASYMSNSPMFWINLMDSRATTKIEDKAYALIGLLELDFQAAYGEGKRSMSRLCEELTKQKRDITWLMRDNFRNGNWTNPAHQTRTGDQYKVSMREVCYRKNLVVSYDEIQIVGPSLKMGAVVVGESHQSDLMTAEIYNGFNYGTTFDMGYACKKSLEEIKSEIKYWWVPSNNIILYLCRYKAKGNPGKFWRIICVRGAPDTWMPPLLDSLETITVDYNTAVYKPDFELEEIETPSEGIKAVHVKPKTDREE